MLMAEMELEFSDLNIYKSDHSYAPNSMKKMVLSQFSR